MKKFNFSSIQSISLFFIFSFLFFSISSCEDCQDIDCLTPPTHFYFQLIDKETNQNLLQNETYSLSDIRIKSVSENQFHNLQIDSIEIEGQKQFILIDDKIGWETENKNYILMIKDSLTFDFVYHTKQKTEECCSYYELEEISSADIEITKSSSSIGFLYKLAL